MALLSLRDVSLAFGGPRLLDRVDLQIERGERLCLLGRNGEGKSTLLRLIRGEIEPDEGEVIRQQGLRDRPAAPGGPRGRRAAPSPTRWPRGWTTRTIGSAAPTTASRRSSPGWGSTPTPGSRSSPRA